MAEKPNTGQNDERVFSRAKLKSFWSNTIWTFKEMYMVAKFDTILYIGSSIFSAIVPNLTYFFSALIVDNIISALRNGTLESAITSFSPLMISILLATGAAALTSIISDLEIVMDQKFTEYYQEFLALKYFRMISTLDIQHHESSNSADLLIKARDGVQRMRNIYKGAIDLINALTSSLTIIVLLLPISPWLVLLALLFAIPGGYFNIKFVERFWQFFNFATPIQKRVNYVRSQVTSEAYAPEHKITGAWKKLSDIHEKDHMEITRRKFAVFSRRFWDKTLANLLLTLLNLIAPILLISKIVAGKMSIGKFTFYAGRIVALPGYISKVFRAGIDAIETSAYVDNLRRLYDLPPAIISGTQKFTGSVPPKIEFKNVWFKYPEAHHFVLKNINLTINPSEEIALVGENGTGKTTIIKLLLRFYDVTKGKILINGTPIQKLRLDDYYDLISSLFQEYNNYSQFDVETNIWLGRPNQKPDKKRVIRAAKAADAYTFIMKLSNKFKQVLSKKFGYGTRISTGQQQKIALARMFYRDSPILILDEPTASIDAAAEHKIFQRIYKFTKNKTVIIISHRFSTVRNAQKIYVLKDGRIAESGSHQQLIAHKGLYAAAFEKQAAGYRTEEN